MTLVEWLVVIALIILLMGLLLPVLNRAHSHADMAGYFNNSKQLQLALRLYTEECGGRYPEPAAAGAQMKAINLVQHATQVRAHPCRWLSWNKRETLDRPDTAASVKERVPA